jgi:hypothetical protein
MRNKDGVSSAMGPLKEVLGFATNVIQTGAFRTSYPPYGSGYKHRERFHNLQCSLNAQGYSAFEYLGYYMYWNPLWDTQGIPVPERVAKVRRLEHLLGDDVMKGFLEFKKTRMDRVELNTRLALEEYTRQRNVFTVSLEHTFGKLQKNYGFMAEVLMQYEDDFDPEFVKAWWQRNGYGVGEKLRYSPEMLVSCKRLAGLLKSNDGDNVYVRASFEPIV